MYRTQNHLHRQAGTSITKAAQPRSAQMCPVTAQWSKKTGTGFSR